MESLGKAAENAWVNFQVLEPPKKACGSFPCSEGLKKLVRFEPEDGRRDPPRVTRQGGRGACPRQTPR